MNRRNLTAAVLAGLAGAAGIVGSAQAVNINPDGLGQVLIYPYYTVNNGNSTFFSVVNTTEWSKAVKVRFLEGMNSREVLDFNLYMSPYDVWVAQINNKGGTPTLRVPDTTCTVPYIHSFPNSEQPFLNFQYAGANSDGGPEDISRSAEGHFEMLEMGAIVPGSPSDTAIVHTNLGVPPLTFNPALGTSSTCGRLIGAWSTYVGGPGYWMINPLTDLWGMTGGLFGSAGVVNVAEGALFTYDPVPINDWARDLFAQGGVQAIHGQPGDVEPSLDSGDQFTGTIFLSTATSPAVALSNTGAFTRPVDAVSFTFQRDQMMNEYVTGGIALAGTEWVVTFPTKNFYVDPLLVGAAAIPPFLELFDGESCEPITFRIWDREEQEEDTPPGGPIVSPPPPDPDPEVFELCYEVNVVQFGSSDDLSVTPSGILGSSHGVSIDNEALGFFSGWMKVNLDDYFDNLGNQVTDRQLGGLKGLPVTGFSVSEFTNGAAAPGVKATYRGLWQHKYTRKCSEGNVECLIAGGP